MDVSKNRILPQKHFILVHGACHGAWLWYKIKPLLEDAGHRVTAIDLAASGANYEKSLIELHSLEDYTMPLLELLAAIPANEGKDVILVGHSYGGFNIALAMDRFPEKVSVAVFLAALMPGTNHPPSYVLDNYFKHIPEGHMMDTVFLPYGSQEEGATSINFGPNYLSTKLSHKCSKVDIELAKRMVRPMSLFPKELSKAKPFSNEGYGSIKRVYIVINEDKAVPLAFQQWLVENIGVEQVEEINNSDHNAMLSNPLELSRCLLEVAEHF